VHAHGTAILEEQLPPWSRRFPELTQKFHVFYRTGGQCLHSQQPANTYYFKSNISTLHCHTPIICSLFSCYSPIYKQALWWNFYALLFFPMCAIRHTYLNLLHFINFIIFGKQYTWQSYSLKTDTNKMSP
jgi:hypothetical protein